MNMLNKSRSSVRAFTIVEMLVVIGILTVLIGLLLPALGRARATSRKTEELSNVRELFRAWTLYGNTYDDAALPGYVSRETQDEWQVKYEYLDRSDLAQDLAGPYTWRLMKFLDSNQKVIHGRQEEPLPLRQPPSQSLSDPDYAAIVDFTFRPSFAYNGLYVGGWWEPQAAGGPTKMRYGQVTLPGHESESGVPVVAKSISQFSADRKVVIFCSAAVLDAGLYHSWGDDLPSNASSKAHFTHIVVPPKVAGQQIWASGAVGPGGLFAPGAISQSQQFDSGDGTTTDPFSLRVLLQNYQVNDGMETKPGVPIARHTSSVAVVYCDGSCASESPGTLSDQRRWIYRADSPGFTHNP